MVYYFQPIKQGDIVFSIDNIILDTSITKPDRRNLLDIELQMMSNGNMVEVTSWKSNKPGCFRNQSTIRFDLERSFWLGRGLNGQGVLEDRCRLDFNPNKVAMEPNFKIIREFLIRNSRGCLTRIPRFDLAIDIPVQRDHCFLVKDHRMYIERRHGKEFTQYLGSKSSTVGRVKLYNKQIQAKLDYPLTRLELTLDPAKSYEEISFPRVYCIEANKASADDLRLTDTERFILNAMLQGYGTLDDLGRKVRKKIELFMKDYVYQIRVTPDLYDAALCNVSTYCN